VAERRAPPNCYWRGGLLWGRIKVAGQEHRWSLRTRDGTIAKRRVKAERERLITELQEALANVKTLSGLLPICMYCKKIRDDQGYWQSVEAYLEAHGGAEFTHGMCPVCFTQQMEKLS